MNDIDIKKQKIFEDKVINILLDGDNEILQKLRKQYENIRVIDRDFTGVGFYTYYDVANKNELLKVSNKDIIRLMDVNGDYKNDKDYFIFTLYIEYGFITCLEGFSYYDKWITDYDNIVLHYYNNGADIRDFKEIMENFKQ